MREQNRLRECYTGSAIMLLTVNPWAISSSGTNSGRNMAGVIHGHLVFIGNNVTITSPLAGSEKGCTR